MANFDDDLLSGLDEFDDDLLLLNVEDGDLGKPAAGSKKKDSSFRSYEEPDDWEISTETRAPRKKGKGGIVAIIIVLAVIIVAIVAVLVARKLNGGNLPWQSETKNDQVQVSETPVDTVTVETQPIESTTAVETETTSTEESEKVPEVSPETSATESETTAEVDLSGIAIMQLQSANFSPNLVGINSLGVPQADTSLGQLDSTAANALQEFIAAARAAGYDTYHSTAYQSIKGIGNPTEEQLEHATGLAVDLVDNNHWFVADMKDDASLADELQWWADHAAEYGFILRYPEGKEDKTGVSYEPYHFTYVGKTIAQEMAENDWCLEEYLDRDNTGTTTG